MATLEQPRRWRVLIVEDNPDLAYGLKLNLEVEGYDVLVEGDGLRACHLLGSFHPDLIILDLMLPGLDGFELVRRWRTHDSDTRILVVSGKTEETDVVTGLRLGADDYMKKPFDLAELLARIHVQLRRAKPIARNVVWIGPTRVDFSTRTATRNSHSFRISPKECALLEAPVEQRGGTLARDVIQRNVWRYKAVVDTNTIDYHIMSLRQKIEEDPKKPQHIITVRKSGI